MTDMTEELGYIAYFLEYGMIILGLLFALKALMQLKEYGAMRTFMSSQTNVIPPIVNMVIAIVFLFSNYFIPALLMTIYGSSELGREPLGTTTLEQDLAIVLQIIGLIAFIRGWLLISRSATQGSQPGTVSKAIVFIFCGILLINIYTTWSILYSYVQAIF